MYTEDILYLTRMYTVFSHQNVQGSFDTGAIECVVLDDRIVVCVVMKKNYRDQWALQRSCGEPHIEEEPLVF